VGYSVSMAQDHEREKSRVGDDLHVDLADRMTYGDYLQLDTLLAAQKPLTEEHDEHLFIVIHQVQELWLNLVAHELESSRPRWPRSAPTACRPPSSRSRG
jgi:hypothetical protein